MSGYHLLDNPPARKQFRTTRRAEPTGCIVLHTAENMLDLIGVDSGAENVARFISSRTDAAGSYHRVGDRDSVVRLVPFSFEAFHDGTGSNRWSIGISLAMRAADWQTVASEPRDLLVDAMVVMAVEASTWLHDEHGITVPARRITRAQSDAGQPGFIPHADRDPARRSDPGPHFPWGLFLARYAALTEQETTMPPNPLVTEIQTVLVDAGIHIGDFGPNSDGIDGQLGRFTVDGVHALKNQRNEAREQLVVANAEIERLGELLDDAIDDDYPGAELAEFGRRAVSLINDARRFSEE